MVSTPTSCGDHACHNGVLPWKEKNILKLRFFRICLLLTGILFLASGCGLKDLDKRFFVLGIGVDRSDNPKLPYRVSLKLGIASPKIEPGITNKYQIVTQDAKSITEAIRLLKSKVDKELNFGHTKIFIFGKSLAENDIQKPLDWFMRSTQIQLIGFVAVGDPSARAVLDTRVISERLPANSLFLSFNNMGTESSYIMTENLSDFYRRMTERGLDPFLPVIRPMKDSYDINQVALFDKQQIKVILTPDQTRVLNQLVLEYPKFDLHTNGEQGKSFDISIRHLKRKLSFSTMQGSNPPHVHIAISMDGFAEESTSSVYDKDWSDLEKKAQKESEERYSNVLDVLRSHSVDPIGLGLRYREMGHVSDADWQRWVDFYPNLHIDVKVKLKILGSGVIK